MRLLIILIIFAHQGIHAQDGLLGRESNVRLGISHSYLSTSYQHKQINVTSEQSVPSYGIVFQYEYEIFDKLNLVSSLRGEYVRKTAEGSKDNFLPDSEILLNNRQYSLTIEGLIADGYVGISKKVLSDNNRLNVGIGLLQNVSAVINERVESTQYYIIVLSPVGSSSHGFRELDMPSTRYREKEGIEIDQRSNFYASVSYERNICNSLAVLIKYDKFFGTGNANLRSKHRVGVSVLVNI